MYLKKERKGREEVIERRRQTLEQPLSILYLSLLSSFPPLLSPLRLSQSSSTLSLLSPHLSLSSPLLSSPLFTYTNLFLPPRRGTCLWKWWTETWVNSSQAQQKRYLQKEEERRGEERRKWLVEGEEGEEGGRERGREGGRGGGEYLSFPKPGSTWLSHWGWWGRVSHTAPPMSASWY